MLARICSIFVVGIILSSIELFIKAHIMKGNLKDAPTDRDRPPRASSAHIRDYSSKEKPRE